MPSTGGDTTHSSSLFELKRLVEDAAAEGRALFRLSRDDYLWESHSVGATRTSIQNAGERITDTMASLASKLENTPRTAAFLPNLASPATPGSSVAASLASEYSSLREEMLQTKSAAEKMIQSHAGLVQHGISPTYGSRSRSPGKRSSLEEALAEQTRLTDEAEYRLVSSRTRVAELEMELAAAIENSAVDPVENPLSHTSTWLTASLEAVEQELEQVRRDLSRER